MRTLCVLLLLITAGAPAWAQTPNRTPEKIEQDRKEAERFKQLYPEQYRFNRAPWLLEDSSAVVLGYNGHSLRLQNNYIVDSIHNNFHNGMPDTTTVMPYSSISVGGARVTISYLFGLIGMGMGKGRIVLTDSAMAERDYDSLKAGTLASRGPGMFIPPSHDINDTLYFRISLNGRLLFDWKSMADFPVSYGEGTDVSELRGTNYPPMTTRSYGKSYLICDRNLNVNDQLLIEIKEHNKNWLVGRFNFTRVAVSPKAKPAFSSKNTSGELEIDEVAGPSLEKKILSGPINRI